MCGLSGLELRVSRACSSDGSGLRVWGLGFKVQGLGFGV